jgi:hypothetical protein
MNKTLDDLVLHWTLAVVVKGEVQSFHFDTCDQLIDFFKALSGYSSYEIYPPDAVN